MPLSPLNSNASEEIKLNNEQEKPLSKKQVLSQGKLITLCLVISGAIAAVIAKRFYDISQFSSDPRYKGIVHLPLEDKMKHSLGFYNLKPTEDTNLGMGYVWSKPISKPNWVDQDKRITRFHFHKSWGRFPEVTIDQSSLSYLIYENGSNYYYQHISLKNHQDSDSQLLWVNQHLPQKYIDHIDNFSFSVVYNKKSTDFIQLFSLYTLPPKIAKLINCTFLDETCFDEIDWDYGPWNNNLLTFKFFSYYNTALHKLHLPEDNFDLKSDTYSKYFSIPEYIQNPVHSHIKHPIYKDILSTCINTLVRLKIKIKEKNTQELQTFIDTLHFPQKLSPAQKTKLIKSCFLNDMNSSLFIAILQQNITTNEQSTINSRVQNQLKTIKNPQTSLAEKSTALRIIAYRCKRVSSQD